MKALIIGATGATGRDLVEVLKKDSEYKEIVIFVRKSSGMAGGKVREVITDFGRWKDVSEEISGDVAFSCLGTTLKAAGSKEKQWKIDYQIPEQFALLAKQKGIESFVLLSAYGASADSKIFYSQMKGKLERRLEEIDFDQYIIFQPGLLLRKDTDRLGERISGFLLTIFNNIGLFRKFRPTPTRLLAEKMAKAPKLLKFGKHVISLSEIFKF